jgi:DNA-directed RNA polymerase subunit L
MTIKVTKIEIKELRVADVAAKLRRAYPFIALSADDEKEIRRLAPEHATTSAVFTIRDANTALANGWRRTILDEMVFPRFTCALEDIKTDDPYCQRLTDYIQNRIWLVPTSYIAPDTDAATFVLDVKNATTANIVVKSREIKPAKPSKFDWAKEIDLLELQPGRSIHITISLEWGINRSHASFSKFHGMIYEPLGYDMTAPPASTTVHPRDYRLGLHCSTLVDAKASVIMGWRCMRDKLAVAAEHITAFQKVKTLPYITTALNVTQIKGDRIRYEFFKETYTLGNLLSWYAYQLDKSVAYIFAGDDHPEDDSILVKITHPDHAALLIAAARAAIADIDAILKQL